MGESGKEISREYASRMVLGVLIFSFFLSLFLFFYFLSFQHRLLDIQNPRHAKHRQKKTLKGTCFVFSLEDQEEGVCEMETGGKSPSATPASNKY